MATSAAADEIVEVVTPAAGESVSEGTILEWHAKVGDFIKAADTIVEISTDKVDVELPAPASGTVVEILVDEGETVTVGQVIARIALNGAGASSQSAPPAAQASAPGAPPTAEPEPGAAGDGNGSAQQASDGAGRAPEADANGSTATAAEPRAEPMRGAAAALARYMEESRTIPTATSFRTLTVTVLDARRRELKEAGQRVSFTHLIAYAIARAAALMPVMTNHFAEIDGKPHRVDDGQINLGLAVAVEERDGSRTR